MRLDKLALHVPEGLDKSHTSQNVFTNKISYETQSANNINKIGNKKHQPENKIEINM